MTAVAVGVACIALTGCIDSEANFEVNEDGTVNGVMTVEMATELGQMFGITSKEAFEEQLLDPESGSIPEGQDVTVTEEDGKYKMKITYDNTPLEDEDMKIEVVSDDQLKFTYRGEGMTGGETGVSADDMEGMEGSIKFTLDFPGNITETIPADLPDSVTIDGNILTIDSDLTETLEFQVLSNRSGTSGDDDGGSAGSSKDDDGGSSFPAFGIGIAVAVLALVAIAYTVVRRRSGDTSDTPTPDQPGSSI